MGLKDLFKKKKQPSLAEDIVKMSDWIVLAMNSSGYKLDYTVESMKEIDRFIDEQSGSDGLIEKAGRGSVLFALGSYIGEAAGRLYGGSWITDDDDPQGEINITFRFKDGSVIYPVQRVMKRYQLGSEESIYAYFYCIFKMQPSD